MIQRRLVTLLLLLFLVVAGFGGQAQNESQATEKEIVLVPGVNGYEGMRDTTIYSENDNADGGGKYFFAGLTRLRDERRALVRFDLSQIPAKSKIISVKLELTVSRARSVPPVQINVAMHRLLKDWGEGEKDSGGEEGMGLPAAEGDATWKSNFHQKSEWEKPGGDFLEEASASAKAGRTGTLSTWESAGLIADVQKWVDGDAENFGWILIGDSTARRFNSAESQAPEQFRPRLTIRFTPPQQGASP